MRTRVLPTRLIAGLAVVLLCGHATLAGAQTSMVPYFGKNNPHYDKFEWHIYTTDHFEIYYYPALEPHLERIAGYAESAYQQISADLKHDLSFKVQLILFKTHSEFEQENIDPGAGQEGVGAFAEPGQKRIVAPIDDPPDRLYGLIVHELTHQFEFDIIPQGLIRRSVPLWVNEGLSDYERGQWEPLDLMAVRDAAIADIIPKMTELEGYGGGGGPSRLIYNLGPRGVRVHRGEVRQGRHPAVPVLAAQERDRRRRGRVRRSAADEEGRVRPELRDVPEGSLQAVPRQGAAGRLRPRSVAEQGEDQVRRGAVDRAVALRRPDRGGHGQPQGPGARHHPGVVEGRIDRPQPDERLRQGPRVRSPRADGRRPGGQPVDGVVAQGRSARLFRAHRERAHADHPERADAQDRRADPDEDGGRARVAGLLARRPLGGVRRAAQRGRRHLHASTSTPRSSPT